MKETSRGAEAVIYLDKDKIIKKRVAKGYRIPILDEKIRKFRTKREKKILDKLSYVPKVIGIGKDTIEMEFLDGEKVRDTINKKNCSNIGKEIGKLVKDMHSKDIIHGDLTTSNMIICKKIKFIDFGLSFVSKKIEDKAVDLHLLKQALESKHPEIAGCCFGEVLRSYKDKEVIKWLQEEVEKRGRHKKRHQ